MLGLRTYIMDGHEFRPVIDDVDSSKKASSKPDTFLECRVKFSLLELSQRASEAGVACCSGLEYA